MNWNPFRRRSSAKERKGTTQPAVRWLEAQESPWPVRVLDLRPLSSQRISTSGNPACAENALSFGDEDGACFVQAPACGREAPASLRFRVDRHLADGVLFTPRAMEEKWALFLHGGQILCVRSWTRRVQVRARVEREGEYVRISRIEGTFGSPDEDPAFTARVLDFLVRSHALDESLPVPLPTGLEDDLEGATTWCWAGFGNRALFATPDALPRREPDRPLRTTSLLHIAVARGDLQGIEAQLAAGVPVDLQGRDGLTPLHWAAHADDPTVAALLLARGSPVDARSSEGATPLMNAVQRGREALVAFLLDRGAVPNARDERGFTALHRAAEMGHLAALRLLLSRGADPALVAQGRTPRNLAEQRGRVEILKALDQFKGPG